MFDTFPRLLEGVITYAKNPEYDRISTLRSIHIRSTREVYLPLINGFVDAIVQDKKFPDADVEVLRFGKCVRLIHPETPWLYTHTPPDS